jgi:acyl carrier protein
VTSTRDLARLLAAAQAASGSGVPSAPAPSPGRHSRPDLDHEYVGPRTDVERVIVEVWQEFLGFDRIGVHDSFFDLGGHSLLATRIVNRLRESFQVPLRLESIFDAPTAAELATVVVASEAEPGQAGESARLLESVAAMSPERVRALLDEPRPTDERA